MHSALYTCRVWHARTAPVAYGFDVGMAWLYLDLDEVAALSARLRLFSAGRRNWFAFYDEDHLPDGEGTLKARALRRFHAAFPGAEAARVRLMAHPRVAGYVFNPVSFFFFFDRDERCTGALAEVRNTFGEVKVYPVPLAGDHPVVTTAKHFYVSPFVALDSQFRFDLHVPGETALFAVDSLVDGKPAVRTGARGVRGALTDGALLRAAVRFPFQTLQVTARIHWHALRLYLKRVPYQRKAERPELQTGILNPQPKETSHDLDPTQPASV